MHAGRLAATCPRGIETDARARTIAVHLTRPDADFLHKLTFQFANVVPADTPRRPHRRSRATRHGPYRFAAWDASGAGTLVRNPHFRLRSPQARPAGFRRPDRGHRAATRSRSRSRSPRSSAGPPTWRSSPTRSGQLYPARAAEQRSPSARRGSSTATRRRSSTTCSSTCSGRRSTTPACAAPSTTRPTGRASPNSKAAGGRRPRPARSCPRLPGLRALLPLHRERRPPGARGRPRHGACPRARGRVRHGPASASSSPSRSSSANRPLLRGRCSAGSAIAPRCASWVISSTSTTIYEPGARVQIGFKGWSTRLREPVDRSSSRTYGCLGRPLRILCDRRLMREVEHAHAAQGAESAASAGPRSTAASPTSRRRAADQPPARCGARLRADRQRPAPPDLATRCSISSGCAERSALEGDLAGQRGRAALGGHPEAQRELLALEAAAPSPATSSRSGPTTRAVPARRRVFRPAPSFLPL